MISVHDIKLDGTKYKVLDTDRTRQFARRAIGRSGTIKWASTVHGALFCFGMNQERIIPFDALIEVKG